MFKSGPVRDEWFTPITLPGITQTISTTACVSTSNDDELEKIKNKKNRNVVLDDKKNDAELLQRLASRHYYSTTTALAITVGVGCILLVLNMLIFAGIYYQRDRDKKRAQNYINNGQNQESLAMSSIVSSQNDDDDSTNREPPPNYTTLPKGALLQDGISVPETQQQQQGGIATLGRPKNHKPPRPPQRTSSSLSCGTSGTKGSNLKKRVQIQEIGV